MCNRFETANALNPGLCSDDRCAQREIETFHALRDEDASGKVARGTERFKFTEKTALRNAAVETSHRAGFAVGERNNNVTQVVWPDAYVAIGNCQDFVARFADHECKIIYFAIFAEKRSASDDANLSFWMGGDELANRGHSGIGFRVRRKNDFVVCIILIAEAGEIFFGAKIHAVNRF